MTSQQHQVQFYQDDQQTLWLPVGHTTDTWSQSPKVGRKDQSIEATLCYENQAGRFTHRTVRLFLLSFGVCANPLLFP